MGYISCKLYKKRGLLKRMLETENEIKNGILAKVLQAIKKIQDD